MHPLSTHYQMIVFDAGGTLVKADWQRVTRDLTTTASENNLAVTSEQVIAGMRETWHHVIAGTIKDTASSRQAVTRFWHQILARALTQAAGLPLPADGKTFDRRVLQTARAFYPQFDDGDYQLLFDDTRTVLTALAKAGYRLGLLSNWSPMLPRVLQRLAIDHFFEITIVSALVHVAKPDPAIFELALQQSGCRPADMLYVGDSPIADIGGSRAAGWDAVLINRRDSSQPHAIDAPYQVASLTELAVALGALDENQETLI